MEWYFPITIIPAIAMIILSTSSQLLGLSSEISLMVEKEHDEFRHSIIERKVN